MYAIVDIETTGGSADNGAITEVAIILHNGEQEEGRYVTLINPEMHVPHYITALTGISSEMLHDAPVFQAVAQQLYNLLEGRIFIAHNVNFDHSFLLHQFRRAGLEWNTRKLCTVRYARKVLPGLPSYSLGNLCRHLGIPVIGRHRAAGDAAATVQLFTHLLQADEQHRWLKELTKGRTAHTYLPMHIDKEVIDGLPYSPGVYYFADAHQKVLYVGKAVNLKYRIKSHFSNNGSGGKRQELLRKIHHITYTSCATELMATVLESVEIKRLWPPYNRSQKQVQPAYGLYHIQCRDGSSRLLVEKKKKTLPALHSFYTLQEGYDMVGIIARKLQITPATLLGTARHLPVSEANQLVVQAIDTFSQFLPSFIFWEMGNGPKGEPAKVLFLVQKGQFTGMGVGPAHLQAGNLAQVEPYLHNYPDNATIRNLLLQEATRRPECVVYLQDA